MTFVVLMNGGSRGFTPSFAGSVGSLLSVLGVRGPTTRTLAPRDALYGTSAVPVEFAPESQATPAEGWDPVAKAVIAEIISAVGSGDVEKGVLDTTEPALPAVDFGSTDEGKYKVPETDFVWLPPDIYKTPEQKEVSEAAARALGSIGPAPPAEDDEMAIDWGAAVSGAIDILQGQVPYAAAPGIQSFVPSGGIGAPAIPAGAKVQIDPKTGKVTLCRRRRRRRLLTPTDLNDLAALKTITGGGQTLGFAVMKAVRR